MRRTRSQFPGRPFHQLAARSLWELPARVVFPSKANELDITVGLVADMGVINPFDFFIESYAETYPFSYPPELEADLRPYLDVPASALGPLVKEQSQRAPPPSDAQPTVQPCALNSAIHGDVVLFHPDAFAFRLLTRPSPSGSAPAGTRPGCS